MTVVTAGFLGLVQGLTEFLPVSSSGHLAILQLWWQVADSHSLAFDAFLHLGTLLAVLVYFRQVWWGIWRNWDLAKKLLIATVPGAAAGYVLENRLENWLTAPRWLALGFLVSAAVLLLSDWWASRNRMAPKEQAGVVDAFWIGLAQAVALVPAISRSGMTIAAGQGRGLPRQEAVRFSFLMSAPIIAGAGLSSLPALMHSQVYPPVHLFVGFLAAFVAGLAAIAFLLKVIERISFWPFAVYLVILSGILLYAS